MACVKHYALNSMENARFTVDVTIDPRALHEVYLPHFYLGAAYLNQGHCDQAVKEFETSRSQGAIRSHPRYAELLDGLKSCEGQVAKVPPATPSPSARPAGPDPAAVAQATQSAEAALARADESARALSALSSDPRRLPHRCSPYSWSF